MLYTIHIRRLTRKRVEITMIPNWLGRLFGRRTRSGIAYRARDDQDGILGWWWDATQRHVGVHIERYIEAAPVMTVEEMPIERLLEAGSDDTKGPR